MNWKYGGLADWSDYKGVAYVSVVFSWQLQEAFMKAVWYRSQGYEVYVGGPAFKVAWKKNSAKLFDGFYDMSPGGFDYNWEDDDAISHHNPDAMMTSCGCVRNCKFCIVPISEGELVEYDVDNYPMKPIICDNNFLACSKAHFDNVVDRLKPLKGIDINGGLDARLITKYQADRLTELDLKVVRLAWDHSGLEKHFMRAFSILRDAGFPAKKIRCYVLMGYDDTPGDALYRLETIKELGAMPNPMRYQPIDTEKKNSYVGDNWTDAELKRYMRYWSRQVWLGHIPFDQYVYSKA